MITFKQYIEFLAEYFEQDTNTERLGQAFLNKFFPKETNSYLFYQEDFSTARESILDKYVDMSTAQEFFEDNTIKPEQGAWA